MNSGKWVLMDPSRKYQFGAQSTLTISARWTLDRIGQTKKYNGNLYLSGLSWDSELLEVLYVAPFPFPGATMMKRCHSIAQGGLKDAGRKNGVLNTGSFARSQAFYNGSLRTGSWSSWKRQLLDQGSYLIALLQAGIRYLPGGADSQSNDYRRNVRLPMLRCRWPPAYVDWFCYERMPRQDCVSGSPH